MPYIFEHLDSIREAVKRSPFGLITDIDGTISQTAPTPQQAEVSPICRRYLSALCKQLALVAVVSGRPVAEAQNMIGIDEMVYIGNHGLERWAGDHSEFRRDAQNCPAVIKAAIEELTPLLSMKCISIDDKKVTATIHYRLCPEPQLARRDILALIRTSPHVRGLRIVQEKMAFDLLPPVKIDKGTALLELIQEYNLQGGVYLGDDLTDIDAFRALHTACCDFDFQGFAIGVTGKGMPEKLAEEADFTLNGVNEVERFLEWLSRIVPHKSYS